MAMIRPAAAPTMRAARGGQDVFVGHGVSSRATRSRSWRSAAICLVSDAF